MLIQSRKDDIMKQGIVSVSAVLLFLLVVSLYPVLGMANTYLPDGVMEVYEGQEREFCFYLQNTDSVDKYFKIELEGNLTLVDDVEHVQERRLVEGRTLGSDLPVCMGIVLPDESEIGYVYNIEYSSREVPSDELNDTDEMVQFAPVTISRSFEVHHVEVPEDYVEEAPMNVGQIFFTGIVGGGIIFIFIGKYKESRRQKMEQEGVKNG